LIYGYDGISVCQAVRGEGIYRGEQGLFIFLSRSVNVFDFTQGGPWKRLILKCAERSCIFTGLLNILESVGVEMTRLTCSIIEQDLPPVFTGEDLRRLEPEDNIRYCQTRRAVADGDIVRLRRGFYTLNSKYRKDLISLTPIAYKFDRDSYVSFESALRNLRWIPEHVTEIMSVTAHPSYTIKTGFAWFSYRHIHQRELLAGVYKVNSGNDMYFQAKPLKALADYIYALKYEWSSLEPVIDSLRIERERMETLTSNDFDEIQGNYYNANVERFLEGVRKELGV
jgi:hypothetical protein